MYYAVEDPAKEVVQIVETSNSVDARQTAEAEYEGNGTLHAREAAQDEIFRYLVRTIGLSYVRLGDRLDVSENYIGYRMRGDRDVRRLDVLALERFREIQDK